MSRIASAGLALVLLVLTAVSLWAVSESQHVSDETASAGVTSSDMGQVQYFFVREESVQRAFAKANGAGDSRLFFGPAKSLSHFLANLSSAGSGSDQHVASVTQVLQTRYAEAFSRYARAARTGHPGQARRIQSASVLPAANALSAEVNGPVERARAAAATRTVDLRRGQVDVRAITGVAFVLGAILLLVFWRVLESFRKRIESEELALKHQTMHDPLTGLPNRSLLTDRIKQAVVRAARDTTPVALLLMDIDRFKEVNDTFGHQTGDKLLQQVAFLVRSVLRQSDTVSRLGGDEFAVVLPNTNQNGGIIAADKLFEALSQPLYVEGQSFHMGASVGIAVYPEHGTDDGTLLRRADVAMYTAKRDKTSYSVYSEEQDQDSHVRLALSRDLRYAIGRKELLLQYQPKMDVRSRQVNAVEALVRWKHPERGMLFPDRFMLLAEQTGLVKPLSLWVLDEAIRQCMVWHEAGKALGIAINLSASSIPDSQLADMIAHYLRAYHVPASMLEIEVTESVLMSDPTRAMQVLSRLHSMGIRIAIDDFGTGYSSLAYLKRLPVDEIKIDKSFVMEMSGNPEDALIVRSIIDLGHNLGLRVVAEGVEDDETWQMLEAMGCDVVQGFFVSRPLNLSDLSFWMSKRQAEAATA